MPKFNIAIDGPSGVGKSTIANILADHYHMIHLDTGAMYRCVAFYLIQNQVDIQNEQELQEALNCIDIHFDGDKVFLNNQDVSSQIRLNEISMAASKISALPLVRNKLVSLQQDIASQKGFILDGRDICTVVLPNAEVKIYMDASSKARAQRRYDEYISKGIDADYEVIFQDIVARDYQDSHREHSPLKVADDAVVIDTSDMTISEVVETIENIIEDIV
ncbi:(d)CMP kinase [uncultured Faecalicoccus sp.]|uniref:(d)CMP kinase n=1 Tax=uncultured Faecalicoccus sp. TaxID=1971760 RepID=UPI0026275589|nr:(d)CMP kinase [uncultured Faecalicoccus sp.]